MQVSGIGAGGMGMGAAAGPAAAGSAPAATTGTGEAPGVLSNSTSPPTSVSEFLAQQVPGHIEQLTELLEGFKTAEILLALMLMAAAEKDDDEKCGGGSAALGFLAGLAIAGQLQGLPSLESPSNAPVPEVAPDGAIGGNIDSVA